MGNEPFINRILNLPWRLLQWWKEANCEHDYHFNETEKGWFTTGSLSFTVDCSKCYKLQSVHMTFPKQKDAK